MAEGKTGLCVTDNEFVFVCARAHTHTHTYTYIYLVIQIYVLLCVYMYVFVCLCVHVCGMLVYMYTINAGEHLSKISSYLQNI